MWLKSRWKCMIGSFVTNIIIFNWAHFTLQWMWSFISCSRSIQQPSKHVLRCAKNETNGEQMAVKHANRSFKRQHKSVLNLKSQRNRKPEKNFSIYKLIKMLIHFNKVHFVHSIKIVWNIHSMASQSLFKWI